MTQTSPLSSPDQPAKDPTLPPDLPVDLPVQDHLCFALYSASQAFTRAYKPLLGPLGLTYPQYLVMRLLWTEDSQSLRDIGRALHLDSGTLTPLLKRLEAQGLLRRARDPKDERLVRSHLTEAGQTLKSRAAHVPGCVAEKLGMSLSEARSLQQQVTRLRAALAPD